MTPNSNICQFQPNGALLKHPNDCQKFYICIQQQAIEYNCNADYHFDDKTSLCVKGASCSLGVNTPASCAEGSIRPVQDNCNIFEACIQGEYQQLNCLPNYYFHAQKSICVPFKYDADFKCNCLMPEYTVLENKDNCETYFVCHQKSAVLKNCPLGRYYNAKLNTCIADLEGVCLMKPTIGAIPSSQTANDIKTSCRNFGLKNIHFQTFPKSCNTFYTCINGQLFAQRCPKDLYYDSDKKFCAFDATNKCLDAEEMTNENNLNLSFT